MRAGLRETRTDLVGFAGEVAKPLGKIDLEVCFGNEGLSRRTSMKFIIIRAPSPYNVILGRPGLKILHAIPSTIHSMIKFQKIETDDKLKKRPRKKGGRRDVTDQIIVNPSFSDQMVTIDEYSPRAVRSELENASDKATWRFSLGNLRHDGFPSKGHRAWLLNVNLFPRSNIQKRK
ncbi:hypothetical protein Tco_0223080 [Tanacetum coccineum]